jgi:hypothetical protein
MSKVYLFAVMLLTGGIIGCIDVSEEDDELIEVLGIDDAYVTASKFLVDKFNDALYGAICEKLMYEDGSFYNDEDVSECVQDANGAYKNGQNNAIMAPDWEYMEFENTGKQTALTGDIYSVTGVGIWCDDNDDCDAAKIIQLYMAQNSESGDWGYAAEGFRTTDGDYLEVIT